MSLTWMRRIAPTDRCNGHVLHCGRSRGSIATARRAINAACDAIFHARCDQTGLLWLLDGNWLVELAPPRLARAAWPGIVIADGRG